MAPSPTIPTSFVPKQPVAPTPTNRYRTSGGNPFLVFAIGIFVIALLGCGAVFGYQQYLIGAKNTKAAQVQKVQDRINADVIEGFVRTRDRFSSAQSLLNNHIAATQFLNLLESITLANVRFSSLTFSLADDHSAQIKMDGTARSFNALAAESSALASEKRIKRAIFSNIKVNDKNNVTFTLDAELSPNLLVLSSDSVPAVSVPAAPVATSTPGAGTSTPQGTSSTHL